MPTLKKDDNSIYVDASAVKRHVDKGWVLQTQVAKKKKTRGRPKKTEE
jgi:hypothetical protein|tara:strand:- start:758 stop:901 length:144 start_codon:yes stop_codon:yes gene_type:complete